VHKYFIEKFNVEEYKMNEKALTPYLTLALLLSLVVSLAPQPSLNGQLGMRVNGFWDRILGSSDEPEPSSSLTNASTNGNSKIFLEVSGVSGESVDDSHKQWIDIQSFSMGMSKPSSGTISRSRGNVIIDDIIVVKELDKSSPKLMEKCAQGQVIPSIVIEHCREVGGYFQTVYRYELTNVLITSFHVSGETSKVVPVEEFSLNFEEITVTYTEFGTDGKSKGNVEFTWKVEEGVF
jgi:type VI secretion system secreted protein Hcp